MEPLPDMLTVAARHGQYQNYYIDSIKRTQVNPVDKQNLTANSVLFTVAPEHPEAGLSVVGMLDGTITIVGGPRPTLLGSNTRHYTHTHEQSRSLAWDMLVAADIFGFHWF